MKKLIVISLSLLWAASGVRAQSGQTDHADGLPKDIPMENYKTMAGGFLLDMGMKMVAPPPLVPPQLGFDFRSLGSTKEYNKLFRFRPEATYSREHGTHVFSRGMYGIGTLPPTLQGTTFRLGNGMRISTYGEYDADGKKVRNPAALPWERNNFNGAFEMRSQDGNFGIRLEVQQGRSSAF